MDDPTKAIVAISLFTSLAYSVKAIATAVVQYRAKSGPERDTELSSSTADARLARLEHAVEAIAIEVERISEGQRFTTKLLAERAQPPAELPRAANRVQTNTPH